MTKNYTRHIAIHEGGCKVEYKMVFRGILYDGVTRCPTYGSVQGQYKVPTY
jgi:hypothetical protein